MFDSDSDSPLIRKLKTAGFDTQGLREKKKKSLTACWQTVIDNSSEKFRATLRAEEVDDVDKFAAFTAMQLLGLALLVTASVAVGVGDFVAAGVCFVTWVIFARLFHQGTLIRGFLRWLADRSDPEPLTDKEVVEHLSRKLKEEKEKALGITVADEKESLEEIKGDLQDYRRELLSQRKGDEQHGLEDEIDVYVSAIDEKIAEIDEALERINEFLADVRQLASDIAAEILPVYRRRQKILEVFDAVPETVDVADEHLDSAEKKLEESQLALERKLKALSESIRKANHITAELGKLKTEDALHYRQLTGVLEASAAGAVEKSSQETADCTRA